MREASQTASHPGVANFSRVDAAVACGGATAVAALESLATDGFKTIINLRLATEPEANIELSQARAKALGLDYRHVPFAAATPDPQVFDTLLATLANPVHQPVYLHCASANRVGAVWLAKRVLQDGYSIEQATVEAKAIGLSSAALETFAVHYIADHRRQDRAAGTGPRF